MRSFRTVLTLAAVATVGLLAGCAGTGESAPTTAATSTSVPSASETADLATAPHAAWAEGGRSIALLTWGSSSCAPIVKDIGGAAQTINVALDVESGVTACTEDYSPRALLIRTPESVDPTKDATLVVTAPDMDETEFDLVGDPSFDDWESAADALPSATWLAPGMVAIITYGASNCAPDVESAEVTSPDTIAVTFAQPSPAGICLRDLAARVSLAAVEGGEAGAALTMTGAGYDEKVTVTGDPNAS